MSISFGKLIGLVGLLGLVSAQTTPSRDEQCMKHRYYIIFGKLWTGWKSYYNSREPCNLLCYVPRIDYRTSFGPVMDGTPCRPGSRDVCLKGACQPRQCALGFQEDKCLVCGGKNLRCLPFQKYIKGPLSYSLYRYHDLVVIPPRSTNIRVMDGTPYNYIALFYGESNTSLINGDWKLTPAGIYRGAGAKIVYERAGGRESVFIRGPTESPITIKLLLQQTNQWAYYEYWQDRDYYYRSKLPGASRHLIDSGLNAGGPTDNNESFGPDTGFALPESQQADMDPATPETSPGGRVHIVRVGNSPGPTNDGPQPVPEVLDDSSPEDLGNSSPEGTGQASPEVDSRAGHSSPEVNEDEKPLSDGTASAASSSPHPGISPEEPVPHPEHVDDGGQQDRSTTPKASVTDLPRFYVVVKTDASKSVRTLEIGKASPESGDHREAHGHHSRDVVTSANGLSHTTTDVTRIVNPFTGITRDLHMNGRKPVVVLKPVNTPSASGNSETPTDVNSGKSLNGEGNGPPADSAISRRQGNAKLPRSCGHCKRISLNSAAYCSAAFAARVKVLSYTIMDGQIQYEVMVVHSYRTSKHVTLQPMEYIYVKTERDTSAEGDKLCMCPRLKAGFNYFVYGDYSTESRRFMLMLNERSYAVPYRKSVALAFKMFRRANRKCH